MLPLHGQDLRLNSIRASDVVAIGLQVAAGFSLTFDDGLGTVKAVSGARIIAFLLSS